jgi:hypothetical protein
MTLPAQRALAQISSSSVTRSAPHKHIRRNRHWALWRRRRHRHLTAGVAVHGIVCASVGPGVMAVVERLLLLWGDPRGPGCALIVPQYLGSHIAICGGGGPASKAGIDRPLWRQWLPQPTQSVFPHAQLPESSRPQRRSRGSISPRRAAHESGFRARAKDACAD